MPENIAIDAEPAPVCAPIEDEGSEKRRRWFELSLVLLISFGSHFMGSVYLLTNGQSVTSPVQSSHWIVGLFEELTCLFLLGYVLSRRRLRIRDLGLRWSFGGVGSGVGVAVVSYISYCVGYILIHPIFHSALPSASTGVTAGQVFGHPSWTAIPFFLLNPFFEELIVRAYLMTEVKALTGSWTLAAALSIALQFSYHLYYGWELAIALAFQFLVFAIYYARTRKATPIIVAHAIFDIHGLIRLW